MRSGLALDQLGTTIKHHMVAAEKHEEKQANHYKSAGIYLKEARERVAAGEYESPHFSHYLQTYAKMSSSRAYELIAIADGTKTVEGIREETNARKQAFRSRTDTKQPTDSIGKSIKQPNNLGGRPVVDELSHMRSLISKKLKLKDKEQLLLIIQFMDGV